MPVTEKHPCSPTPFVVFMDTFFTQESDRQLVNSATEVTLEL